MGNVINKKSGIGYTEDSFFGNKYAVPDRVKTYIELEEEGGVLVSTQFPQSPGLKANILLRLGV